MEASSASDALPAGVNVNDLYDGPKPGEVVRPLVFTKPAELVAPIPPPPQVSVAPEVRQGYAALLTAALDVLSARLLGLLAVVAACGMWSYAVWEPNTLRTIAASLFSLTVLLPLIVLYWKAG